MTLKTYAIGSTFGIKRCKIPRFRFFFLREFFSRTLLSERLEHLSRATSRCLVGLWLRDRF